MIKHCIHKRTLFQTYSGPPRVSYSINKTYPKLIWNNLMPQNLKYLTALGTAIISFIKIHPKYWVTLGPPIAATTYLLNRFSNKSTYRHHADIIRNSRNATVVKILPYHESHLYNIQAEIESQYDSLRVQLVDLAEKRISASISATQMTDFVTRDQVNINIPAAEIETWMPTQVALQNGASDSSKLVVMSVPYYDSKNKRTRKRLGVVVVHAAQKDEVEWKMVVAVTRLRWWGVKDEEVTGGGGAGGGDKGEVLESDLFSQFGKG
ncbi:uncharacterized protein LODBEIA_P60190 [Lodderomyces beijingensis]|uniref:Uncharacterized protein n=1 Tax=Lodderomyces beijingensis TaxID=1775926 RepID=A0ABP0ZW25_9ASCO